MSPEMHEHRPEAPEPSRFARVTVGLNAIRKFFSSEGHNHHNSLPTVSSESQVIDGPCSGGSGWDKAAQAHREWETVRRAEALKNQA